MKLRPYRSDSVGRKTGGYEFWCQGCARTHAVATWADNHHSHRIFQFNGDPDHPTFSPSVQTSERSGEWIDDGLGGKVYIPTRCWRPYCVVRIEDGKLKYTRESAHYLAGTTVSMQDIPSTREDRIDRTNLSRQLNARFEQSRGRANVVVGVGFQVTA